MSLREALGALYRLQEMDLAILKLARQLQDLNTGASERAAAERALAAHKAVAEELHTLQANLRDAELELKTIETKQKDHTQRLYSGKIVNPKELDALQHEVEMLGRMRSKLDERILEMMEQQEQLQAQEKELREKRDAAVAAYKSVRERHSSASRDLQARLSDLQTRRAALAREVEPALLARYESIRATKNGVGIAKVQGGHCGACRTQLPRTTLLNAKESARLVTCDACGRLVYAEEQA